MISELTKRYKDAEHERDKVKNDLEIADDKSAIWNRWWNKYIEKQLQIEKDLI